MDRAMIVSLNVFDCDRYLYGKSRVRQGSLPFKISIKISWFLRGDDAARSLPL
jgi:hypothetical protein